MKLARALAVMTAALAGTMLFGAGPAAANTGWDRCPQDHFCVFTAPNGGGRMAYFQWGSPDLRAQGVDGQAYSMWNRMSKGWDGYSGYNYGGFGVWGMLKDSRLNLIPKDAQLTHSIKVGVV